jgi:hypothetical protein
LRECRERFPDRTLEIWFQDEARFGQKGRLTAVWGQRGSRPTLPRQNGFTSGYLFGAVNPQTGAHSGLVFSNCDTAIMNIHLQMISQQATPLVQLVLIMDGAGWHRSHELTVPANITLFHLPPYCPERNPVERLWLWLKDRFLSNRCFEGLPEIISAGATAWSALEDAQVRSVCRVSWLESLLA